MTKSGWNIRNIIILVAALLVQSGCAAHVPVVQNGDRVGLHYACRLQTGELAAATMVKDQTAAKAGIYLPKKDSEPLSLTAGSPESVAAGVRFPSFEDEIARRLAVQVVGMRQGESKSMTVVEKKTATDGQGKLQIARVRVRPKELRISRDTYMAQKGTAPEVGKEYAIDPLIPGKVESVNDNEVLIRFSAVPGTEVSTPFGKGTIKSAEYQYEIHIDARPGSLVRSGPMVGKIIKVDDRLITLDYSNPFGGEELACDVTVLSVEQQAGQKDK